MNKKRLFTLIGIIVAAAVMRLLPHPPNFTPIAALALFGGATLRDRRVTFAVPLGAMLLSDGVLALTRYGWEAFQLAPFVYSAFLLMVVLGHLIRNRRSMLTVGSAAIAGSVLFFIVTNFGVWLRGNLYPLTATGLLTCYASALPYFRNTLAGDAAYIVLLFGGLTLAERMLPSLRERTSWRESGV